MISCNLLFVPIIFPHALVVLNALKRHLAKAIEFCQIDHVLVKELSHGIAGLGRVVNLFGIYSAPFT